MKWIIGVLTSVSALSIALPFAIDGGWSWAVTAIGIAVFWMVVPSHSYGWSASLSLLGLAALAAVAVLRTDMIGWVLPGVLAALAAWDLCALMQRLALTDAVRHREIYLRSHLLQLAGVLITAWLLGLLALQITVPIDFLWALGLLLLLVIGLGTVIRAARADGKGWRLKVQVEVVGVHTPRNIYFSIALLLL